MAQPRARSEPRRIGSRRSERGWSPSSSIHSVISFLQRGQRIDAGRNKIVNAGRPQQNFLFAGPACQIDMSGAGGLKGLCGRGSMLRIDLVGGTKAGEGRTGRFKGGAECSGIGKPFGIDRLDAAGLEKALGEG